MTFRRALTAAAALTLLAGCGHSGGASDSIGLIDVQRITNNWPKFLNYQNQLAADAQTIERSGGSEAQKARKRAALQQRFAQDQTELTGEVSAAARQVATDRHLTYVFTRQYVGYGGVDITGDVEKILKIVEKPSPSP